MYAVAFGGVYNNQDKTFKKIEKLIPLVEWRIKMNIVLH